MPEAGEKTSQERGRGFWRRLSGAARLLAAPAALFLVLTVLMALGGIAPLDNALMDARFRMVTRAPSDTLVLVEIDPRSLREEELWPWPRDRYAKAIETLQDAGAALIAFDVDFSSLSDPAGDAAFAQALARRPGEVILPVFWQWSSGRGGQRELINTPPHEKFLNDAVIASVTLTAENNGVLRRGWRAVEDDGAYRTSIADMLAGVPADRRDTFYIDFGIDASAIDRLSFRDVLNGDFPPKAVRGKNILIGATALELGDEFAAPVLGVTPGVTLHALGYESLVQTRALTRTQPAIPLALAGLMLLWLTRKPQDKTASSLAITHSLLLAVLIAAPVGLQALFPVSFDAGAMLAAQGLSLLYVGAAQLRHRALQIIRHRAATLKFQELTAIVVRDNADGVIVTDETGGVELCSERAKELLGFKGDILPGADISHLASGFPVLPAAKTGLRETAYSEFVAPSGGAILEIIATRSATPAGKTRGREKPVFSGLVVYTLRDISARKRIEEAERKAKEAAIAANALKTQLISNMSHELRTPLNGVIGFASIMKDEAFGAHATPEYKEYSQNIHDSGKRLLGLINNMLNIAKLDAGEFEVAKDPAPLDEILEKSLSGFKHEILRRNASVAVEVQEGLPDAMIDASVFHEMISQLISNALKFTGSDAKIILRAYGKGSDLTLEVEDNGCGADPALFPKLTDVFFQGDGALNRAHEGAGLGLYLVAKFASLHGGALRFESERGQGFLARLDFPDTLVKSGNTQELKRQSFEARRALR